jgi:hypothetical protein
LPTALPDRPDPTPGAVKVPLNAFVPEAYVRVPDIFKSFLAVKLVKSFVKLVVVVENPTALVPKFTFADISAIVNDAAPAGETYSPPDVPMKVPVPVAGIPLTGVALPTDMAPVVPLPKPVVGSIPLIQTPYD